jgi:hypothetical protein
MWIVGVGTAYAARGESSFSSVAQSAPRQTSTSSLESRAQEYWARRQAKDLSGAYPYYCSAYRARVSLAQFLQMTRLVRFDLRDVRVTVTDAASAKDRAEVTIAYKFLMPTLGDQLLDGQTKEVWARDPDGQWCKQDEPVVLPFPASSPTPSAALGVLRAVQSTKS